MLLNGFGGKPGGLFAVAWNGDTGCIDGPALIGPDEFLLGGPIGPGLECTGVSGWGDAAWLGPEPEWEVWETDRDTSCEMDRGFIGVGAFGRAGVATAI